MRNLFDGESAAALKARIGEVRRDSERQWGRMTPAQAIAHCAALFDVAVGDTVPTRMFIGRLIGGMVRQGARRRQGAGAELADRPRAPEERCG